MCSKWSVVPRTTRQAIDWSTRPDQDAEDCADGIGLLVGTEMYTDGTTSELAGVVKEKNEDSRITSWERLGARRSHTSESAPFKAVATAEKINPKLVRRAV